MKQVLTATVAAAMLAGSAALAASDLVYVSNETDDTISVIDTATQQVIDTIPVGLRPRGITFTNDYKHLLICASDSNAIQMLDVATGEVVVELPSGDDPEQFALHPNGKWLYIANEDDALATVLDIETQQPIAEINIGVEPEGVAVSHGGDVAVVTSETTNMVHWIDTASQSLVANTLVGSRPRDAMFSHDDQELWVSAEIGGTVTVYDVASKTEKHLLQFALPGVAADRIQPVGIELTSDGAWAFVALGPANHVAVVNRATMTVEDYILVGRRVWHMALTPDEKSLYTTNGLSGDVTLIDVDSQKATKTIKVGRFPWGAAVLPASARPAS